MAEASHPVKRKLPCSISTQFRRAVNDCSMRILGWSIRHIAGNCVAGPSIISRELRQNWDGTAACIHYSAHCDAQRRRRAVQAFMPEERCVGDVCVGEAAAPMFARTDPSRVRLDYPHTPVIKQFFTLVGERSPHGRFLVSLPHHDRRRRKRYGSGPCASRITG